MRAAKLNKRVRIERLTDGQDDIGQPVQVWSLFATVWASVLLKNGAQTIKSDADVSIVQASIRIRKRTDITPNMHVVDGAATYDIRAVLPDEASRQHVDLVCERVA